MSAFPPLLLYRYPDRMKIERKVVRRREPRVEEPPGLSEDERIVWQALVKQGPLTEQALLNETNFDDLRLKVTLHTLRATGHVLQKGWKFRLRWQPA